MPTISRAATGSDPGEHWYDPLRLSVSLCKKGRSLAGAFDPLVRDYAQRFFALLARCPRCAEEEKRRQNAVFVDGLLQNGGPAVNLFRRILGEEPAARFLREVMFDA